MSEAAVEVSTSAIEEATRQIQEAAAAKKCWHCGCLHSSLKEIEQGYPAEDLPAQLQAAMGTAHERLADIQYDCLGCAVCYPAIATNVLEIEVDSCATAPVEERAGWPPLPGDYQVGRYQAPVAVCTLTDSALAHALSTAAAPDLAIVGTLQTENLGIERLIQNVLADPNIRFLVLCGADSQQAIGHLPGQSLVALAQSGLDERGRIIGAPGKRPRLRNIEPAAVDHFRRTVEVVDRVGACQLETILETVQTCAQRYEGPAQPFAPEQMVKPIKGYIPERMVSDPAGYFVVYVNRQRQRLVLEHYHNNGVLDVVVEGTSPAELYIPAVEQGLVSRLDHAAYLGRELAQAEHALESGEPYIQDAAPEQATIERATGCGCKTSCGG